MKWNNFVGMLGPFPTSSRKFWYIVNRARSAKRSGTVPRLTKGDISYKTDTEKAGIFALILLKTLSQDLSTSNLDNIFRKEVDSTVDDFY